jgi:glucose/arabinose dehydrogenase
MGRDNLGPDLPPEELNLLRDNYNYGWPYCYGNRHPNPEYADPALCADTPPPSFVFPAHWAPLGIDFYDQAVFPGYRNDALIAFHGSAPSQTGNDREGARVIRVRFEDGRPIGYHDLVRGFGLGNRTWARPAGVLVAPDGSVLVSDDYGGRMFRIRYVGDTPSRQAAACPHLSEDMKDMREISYHH